MRHGNMPYINLLSTNNKWIVGGNNGINKEQKIFILNFRISFLVSCIGYSISGCLYLQYKFKYLNSKQLELIFERVKCLLQ